MVFLTDAYTCRKCGSRAPRYQVVEEGKVWYRCSNSSCSYTFDKPSIGASLHELNEKRRIEKERKRRSN
jgi:hypothetical protein